MAIKYEESQQPKNTPSSQTRRSALKKMLVGTGVATGAAVLPDKWAKPIVDKVLVPAHAATSTITLHDTLTLTILSVDPETGNVTVKIDGYVTPATSGLPATIDVTPAAKTAKTTTLNPKTDAQGKFTATTTLAGPGITKVRATATVQGAIGRAVGEVDVNVKPTTTAHATTTTTTQKPTTTPAPTTTQALCGTPGFPVRVNILGNENNYFTFTGIESDGTWIGVSDITITNKTTQLRPIWNKVILCDGSIHQGLSQTSPGHLGTIRSTQYHPVTREIEVDCTP